MGIWGSPRNVLIWLLTGSTLGQAAPMSASPDILAISPVLPKAAASGTCCLQPSPWCGLLIQKNGRNAEKQAKTLRRVTAQYNLSCPTFANKHVLVLQGIAQMALQVAGYHKDRRFHPPLDFAQVSFSIFLNKLFVPLLMQHLCSTCQHFPSEIL